MLSAETQIRYLLQWFQEWNDFQRTDFLPVMIEKYSNIYQVNGISSDEETDDKPLSLFECRVKLFKEWFVQWSIEHKDDFLQRLKEIDRIFGEKLNTALGQHGNREALLED